MLLLPNVSMPWRWPPWFLLLGDVSNNTHQLVCHIDGPHTKTLSIHQPHYKSEFTSPHQNISWKCVAITVVTAVVAAANDVNTFAAATVPTAAVASAAAAIVTASAAIADATAAITTATTSTAAAAIICCCWCRHPWQRGAGCSGGVRRWRAGCGGGVRRRVAVCGGGKWRLKSMNVKSNT